jgi:hypothetical protein
VSSRLRRTAEYEAASLELRLKLVAAPDDLLLNRTESAMFVGLTPGGFSNKVTKGQIAAPVHAGGEETLPRWRLGSLRPSK